MAVVTLTTAKVHLRETGSTRDADIQIKLDQAIAIVLDYLKARLIAIETISIANPTVITTSVPHSLTSGTTYTIFGTTTTPTVNGAQVVTVTGPKTFTVPVNVTIGQSAAAGTIGGPSWTDATVPKHIEAAILLVLGHLDTKRGDDMASDQVLWDAVGRVLMRSRDPAIA